MNSKKSFSPSDIPCKRPDKILNGLYDPNPKDEYYVGSVVIYRCEPDFSLIGNSTITCITEEDGLNGKWNLPAPECKHVKCDRPKVENGKITSSFKPSYTYNEAISFECNSGYSAVGSLHIKCGANSSWIPAIPKCVKVALSTTPQSEVGRTVTAEKPATTSKDYAECNKTTALGKLIILLAVLYNCW
ncbi:membrane cofactor protein-like [Vipera latastei]